MTTRAPLYAALAALLLAVGFWYLIWSPKSEEQAAFEAETVELETQVATLRTELDRLLEIQENQFEYEAQLSRLEEYVPTGAAQPAALQALQEAADLAGVEITSLTNGDPVLVEGAPPAEDPEMALASIPVAMTMDGGYFQHVDLLRRMEVDIPRALLVRTVALTEAEAGFPELTTTWSGEMFAVVPIAAAAPAETATPGAEGEVPAEGATEQPAAGTEAQAASDTTEPTS